MIRPPHEVAAAIQAMRLSAEGDAELLPDATIETLDHVAARRMHQIGNHGFDAAHDDGHQDPWHLADLIRQRVEMAICACHPITGEPTDNSRDLMVDVAALAVAAIEAIDRRIDRADADTGECAA